MSPLVAVPAPANIRLLSEMPSTPICNALPLECSPTYSLGTLLSHLKPTPNITSAVTGPPQALRTCLSCCGTMMCLYSPPKCQQVQRVRGALRPEVRLTHLRCLPSHQVKNLEYKARTRAVTLHPSLLPRRSSAINSASVLPAKQVSQISALSTFWSR